MKDRALHALPFLVGLSLVAFAAFAIGRCSAPEDTAHEHATEDTVWTCSMHPQVRQPEAGLCPICGMDLIPLTESSALASDEVALSPRAAALAEIRTTPVRRLPASGASMRLLGRVELDETTLDTVTTWVGGRIDRLHVRVTGQRIRRGQTIATLYSPEVYAAQQDLITARRQLERLAGASELARAGAQATLDSARQRLRLLGLPDAELRRLEGQDAPSRRITIRSPFGGTVIERLATEGAYVETGSALYRVADLDRLWVQLDAYEPDLPQLSVGQTVRLEVQGLPGEPLTGRIAFIDPVVDARTRTAQVRVEVSNPEGALRPGMFVEAALEVAGDADAPQPLVIPASAPLFTGQRAMVYVAQPGADRPTYRARPVRLGARVGDVYPVVAGLAEGDRVVTHGAFAIDADLQIRGGESLMNSSEHDAFGAAEADVPETFRAGLRPILEAYLALQRALADDQLETTIEAATSLERAVAAFSPSEPEPLAARYAPIAARLRIEAQRVTAAASLEAARGSFEPASAAVADLLRAFGNPLETPLHLARCPMAFDNRGAEWVQDGETIDNAYFGASMLTCGSLLETVPPGGFLPAEATR
ncbi:MAG: efflux RND transporter periplasmic adaptor subunit [Sandaracinaceae bacterium]